MGPPNFRQHLPVPLSIAGLRVAADVFEEIGLDDGPAAQWSWRMRLAEESGASATKSDFPCGQNPNFWLLLLLSTWKCVSSL